MENMKIFVKFFSNKSLILEQMSNSRYQRAALRTNMDLNRQERANNAFFESHLYHYLNDARRAIDNGRRESVLYEILGLGYIFIRDRLQSVVGRDRNQARLLDIQASLHASYPLSLPLTPYSVSSPPSPSSSSSSSSEDGSNRSGQGDRNNTASHGSGSNGSDGARRASRSSAPPLAPASPRLSASPPTPSNESAIRIAREIVRQVGPTPSPLPGSYVSRSPYASPGHSDASPPYRPTSPGARASATPSPTFSVTPRYAPTSPTALPYTSATPPRYSVVRPSSAPTSPSPSVARSQRSSRERRRRRSALRNQLASVNAIIARAQECRVELFNIDKVPDSREKDVEVGSSDENGSDSEPRTQDQKH